MSTSRVHISLRWLMAAVMAITTVVVVSVALDDSPPPASAAVGDECGDGDMSGPAEVAHTITVTTSVAARITAVVGGPLGCVRTTPSGGQHVAQVRLSETASNSANTPQKKFGLMIDPLDASASAQVASVNQVWAAQALPTAVEFNLSVPQGGVVLSGVVTTSAANVGFRSSSNDYDDVCAEADEAPFFLCVGLTNIGNNTPGYRMLIPEQWRNRSVTLSAFALRGGNALEGWRTNVSTSTSQNDVDIVVEPVPEACSAPASGRGGPVLTGTTSAEARVSVLYQASSSSDGPPSYDGCVMSTYQDGAYRYTIGLSAAASNSATTGFTMVIADPTSSANPALTSRMRPWEGEPNLSFTLTEDVSVAEHAIGGTVSAGFPMGSRNTPSDWDMVCVIGNGDMPVNCGGLFADASDPEEIGTRFRVAIPQTLTTVKIQAMVHRTFGANPESWMAELQNIPAPNENLTVPLQNADENPGGDQGDGEFVAGDGCFGNSTPDVVGRVALPNGTGYATTVSVLSSWSSLNNPFDSPLTNNEVRGVTASASDGTFRFCSQGLFGDFMPGSVAVVAELRPEDRWGSYAVPTTWQNGSCLGNQSCLFNVTLSTRSLTVGNVFDAADLGAGNSLRVTVRIPPNQENYFRGVPVQSVLLGSGVTVAAFGALPAGSYQVRVSVVAGHSTTSAQAVRLVPTTSAITVAGNGTVTPPQLSVTVPVANVVGVVRQPNGEPLSDTQDNRDHVQELKVVRDHPDCSLTGPPEQLDDSCTALVDQVGHRGNFVARIGDGTWNLVVKTQQYPQLTTTISASGGNLTSGGRGTSIDGSNLTVTMRQPNVVVKILGPGGTDPGAQTGAELTKLDSSGGFGMFYQYVTWTNVSQTTPRQVSFSITPPTSGEDWYQITAQPPMGNPNNWRRPAIRLKVDHLGVISTCPVSATDLQCDSTTTVTNVTGSGLNAVYELVPLQFSAATLTARVVDPDGSPVSGSWVEVRRKRDDGGDDWLGGSETNEQGLVGLDNALTENGTYTLVANPPWVGGAGFTAGRLDVTVSGSPGSLEFEGGQPTIQLQAPNVSGTVTLGNGPARWAGVQAEEWDEDENRYVWSNIWTNTNTAGEYQLTLTAGLWRITAQPSPEQSANASAASTVVTVSASGSVRADITLDSPNFYGLVTTSASPVVGGFIWVDRMQDGRPEPAGLQAQVNARGRFALRFTEAGQYRMNVEPAPGQNLVRTVVYVSVSASLAIVECDQNFGSCGGAITSTAQSPRPILLSGPNVRGVVMANGTTVSAWVAAERWNDGQGRFEWSEIFANSDRNGFGLSLPAGQYRVTAWPNFGNSTANFSRVQAFVSVSATTSIWCRTNGPNEAAQGPCPATSLTMALQEANIQGLVTTSAGGPVRNVTNSWVNVEVRQGNEWRWVDGGADVRSGRFSLTLEGAASPGKHYRLTVNPPWGSANLSPKKIEIWVLTNGDYCLTTCGTSVSAGTQIPIEMTSGNVSGTVSYPNSGGVAAEAEVFVESWNEERRFWQWAGIWGRTNSSGAFTLDIDGQAPKYRITARAPWGSSRAVSPVSTDVSVSASNLCVIPTGQQNCTPTSSISLNMVLGSPNVTLTVSNSGSPVQDAWLGVERQEAGGNWVWTGSGTSTNASGIARFSLSAGTYRVWVNPPWTGTGSELSRFSQTITVAEGGSVTQTLTFPQANFTTIIKDGTGAVVANAWVSARLYNATTGTYEWQDKVSHSNGAGRVSFNLGDGQWRIEVNPPPGDDYTGLARTEVDVTLPGAVPGEIVLQSPNVVGTVSVSASVRAQFGFVEVRYEDNLGGSTISAGTPYDENGRFALRLATNSAGTTYRLSIFPNPAFVTISAQPIVVIATVSAESPLSWRVLGDASDSTGDIVVDFADEFGAPNLTVTVTASATSLPQVGAIVTLTPTGSAGTPITLITDDQGVARGVVPIANYDIDVVMPAAVVLKRRLENVAVGGNTSLPVAVE